ncbi:hypothetical protein DFQ26_003710 [Actinomortierella ambigua]|nr:hypothetical protein DFQ26_003710 [Actinomortierella ambigua]
MAAHTCTTTVYSYSLTEGLSAEQQKQVYGGETRIISIRAFGHGLRRQRRFYGVDHKTSKVMIDRYCTLRNGCPLSGND